MWVNILITQCDISTHTAHKLFQLVPYIYQYPHVFHINGKSCYRKKKKTFLFSLHTYYLGHPIGKALFHDYGPPMFLRSPIISKLFNYFSRFLNIIYHHIMLYLVYFVASIGMFLFYFFDHVCTPHSRNIKTLFSNFN